MEIFWLPFIFLSLIGFLAVIVTVLCAYLDADEPARTAIHNDKPYGYWRNLL